MATLGDAYIEVHADTGPFDRELVAAIEAALIRAEATMRQHGRDAGNAFSDGVEVAVRDRTDDIGDTLAEGLVDGAEEGARRASAAIRQGLGDIGDGRLEGIHIPIDVDDDELDETLERTTRTFTEWASDLGRTLLNSTTGMFGILSGNLGQSLAGLPIMAGGITLLIGAVIGLAQVLNPAFSLLSAIPGLLSIIGALGLTLYAVFGNLGEVITKAFAAKDKKELAEVLKGLDGATKTFITTLLELRNVWKDIGEAAQSAFLKPLGNKFQEVIDQLKGPLKEGIVVAAEALGRFAAKFAEFLKTPEVKEFIKAVFPALAGIIDVFGPPVLNFFRVMAKLAVAAMPFVEKLFVIVGFLLTEFAGFIEEAIDDKSFQKFLDNATGTLSLIGQILKGVITFIKEILTWLNESGEGDNFLQTIVYTLEKINEFISSDAGKDALKFLVEAAGGAILAFGYLFVTILKFIAFLEFLKQTAIDFLNWIYQVGVDLGEFLSNLAGGIYNFGATVGAFLVSIGQKLWNWFDQNVIKPVADGIATLVRKVEELWRRLKASASEAFNAVVATIKSLPGRAASALSGIGSTLLNAGKMLIDGFVQGIKNAIPNLTGILSYITDLIPNIKGPEAKDLKLLQPAGQALMEGLGIGIKKGAAEVLGDLSALTGMISVTANPNTFNFGRGAIQQNFTGNPTPAVATSMGNATGTAIANTVNNQTMRANMRAA